MTKRYGWLAFSVLALLGCGGTQTSDDGDDLDGTSGEEVEPGDSTEGHASARELIGINPPEQPWSEMSHEDKEMDMVARFHPIFREIFIEHDAEEYAEFGCESCHGDDMRERDFAMPSAHLPTVAMPGTPEYAQMAAEHPNGTRFMEEVVTPAMQTMLGMGATFTCNGCHPAP